MFSPEGSGWSWLMIDVVLVAILGVALFYAMLIWRRRKNSALERVRDQATRELYREGDREERTERPHGAR